MFSRGAELFRRSRTLRKLCPEAWDAGFWRGEEHYLRLFHSCGDAVWLGEASTNYTKRPMVDGVPERLHRFNPEARFIYVMRDPIERTISHYWHMVSYHAERRPILKAIKPSPSISTSATMRCSSHRSSSGSARTVSPSYPSNNSPARQWRRCGRFTTGSA